eukprot:Awhi_evm2s5774
MLSSRSSRSYFTTSPKAMLKIFHRNRQTTVFPEFVELHYLLLQETVDGSSLYNSQLDTFAVLLSNDVTRSLFGKFLENENASENLGFWEAIQEYKDVRKGSDKYLVLSAIAYKYLRPGSPLEIYIDDKIRQMVYNCLRKARIMKEEEVNEAQGAIEELLMDSFI